MTVKFLQSDLWKQITSLAKKAKRKYVAVAYLGQGASELLPLNRGDVLIVDMSMFAMRSGQTNPYEVEKYLKSGVEIHTRSNLHAKVFVFDKQALISSSNVSHNSKDNLDEAAVLTNEIAVVQAARGFILSLRGEYVTPAYLKACKQNYQLPKWNQDSGKRIGNKKREKNEDVPMLWVHKTTQLTRDDKKRDRAVEKSLPNAKRSLRNQRQYLVDWYDYPDWSDLIAKAQIGDLFIAVWRESDDQPLKVYPPCRIIKFEPYVDERGYKKTIFHTECPKRPKCLSWKDFKLGLEKIGFSNISENLYRKVSKPDAKQRILGLWDSIHDD